MQGNRQFLTPILHRICSIQLRLSYKIVIVDDISYKIVIVQYIQYNTMSL